jgi:triacylglycerol lipase
MLVRTVAAAACAVVIVVGGGATGEAGAGGPEPRGARPPRRCGAQTRLVPSLERARGSLPVLLVHGFAGSARDFARTRGDGPSMRRALTSLPGVSVYAFDYSDVALDWVTNPKIGPSLARAVTCLREGTGRRVVVVAHSMGGLAARFAQGEIVDGHSVADSIRRVVTIGAPNRGVILLSLTNGEVSSFLVDAAVEAAELVCDKAPPKPRRELYDLLRAATIPAVQAMAPGSAQLAALPPWDPRVPVVGIAADLRLRVSAFGLGTTVSLGDIVVTVESAIADTSPGVRPFVARCRTELTGLVEVVDASACSHANEIANRRIVRRVADDVHAATGMPT